MISCQNDDLDFEKELVTQELNVRVVGQDLDTVYLYDYDSSTDTGIQTNLSSELGININYLTLRQFENTLSFFAFSNNAISLFQKNLSTGAVETYPGFYDVSSERSLIWGTNDADAVYFGLYKPLGTTNLALRVIDLNTLEGTDLTLEFGIEKLYEPLYDNGKLYLTYKNGTGDFKITIYDTLTNSLAQTLDFGNLRPSIIISDLGDLAVFTRDENDNSFFELLNSNTFESISKTALAFEEFLEPGPIKGALINNKLYYQYTYAQPFDVEIGPAIFNLDSGENRLIDLVGIVNNLNLDSEFFIQPLIGQYLISKNVFAVSYVLQNGNSQELGGMFYITPEGEVISKKNLNFIPTYFID